MITRFLNLMDRTAQVTIVVVAGVMTIVVCSGVFLRYGFNSSLDWGEETARLCFVWMIFIAIPLAVKRGLHVSVEVFTHLLPQNAQKVLRRITMVLSAVLMVIVIYYSFVVLLNTWYDVLLTIPISSGWFTVPITIGAFHSALHLVNQAIHGMPDKKIEEVEELG